MTAEDEGFVRRIVDSPGDDTPRLVYADWLDERGDPRSMYLREELELAETDEWGTLKALRLAGLSRGLDPVWLARVSRPPAGVCCDRLSFDQPGPTLEPGRVSRFEIKYLLDLGDCYRAFMLNYNGGSPRPAVGTRPVDRFYPLARSSQRNLFDNLDLVYRQFFTDYLGRFYHNDEDNWHERYLPIGRLSSTSDMLAIGVRAHVTGRVFAINHRHNYDPSNAVEIAASLADFLATVTPDVQ